MNLIRISILWWVLSLIAILGTFVALLLYTGKCNTLREKYQKIERQIFELGLAKEDEGACLILQTFHRPSHRIVDHEAYEEELLRWEAILRRCQSQISEKRLKQESSLGTVNVLRSQDKVSDQT